MPAEPASPPNRKLGGEPGRGFGTPLVLEPGHCAKQLTTIDTCYTWGHVKFDDNDVLWSACGPAGVNRDPDSDGSIRHATRCESRAVHSDWMSVAMPAARRAAAVTGLSSAAHATSQ